MLTFEDALSTVRPCDRLPQAPKNVMLQAVGGYPDARLAKAEETLKEVL